MKCDIQIKFTMIKVYIAPQALTQVSLKSSRLSDSMRRVLVRPGMLATSDLLRYRLVRFLDSMPPCAEFCNRAAILCNKALQAGKLVMM